MTLATGNFSVDVALMVEQHMLWNVVDFYPGGRGLRVEIAVFDLNPWVVDDDVIMAVQTFFDRRQAGKIGICHIRMTILTLNLLDAGVNIVTEGYGLFRPESGQGCCPEEVYKRRYREYRKKR